MGRPSASLACILISVILAGCATPHAEPEAVAHDGSALPAVETSARNHSFQVSSMGAMTTVAATIYTRGDAPTSAVLAVHGSAGTRTNNWGQQPVPGYSLGHRVAENGTDLIAIDLPGYGDSAAPGPIESFEDYALVVAEITDALREGSTGTSYERVVGLGHSMGGAIVDEAQAIHRSFDAIAVTGWAHAGFSDEFNECFPTRSCPERVDQFFDTAHMDETVLEAMMATFEGAHTVANTGNLYWGVRPGGTDAQGHQGSVTSSIEVPVLVMLGANDWHWNARNYDHEASYYPSAASFHLVVVPDAGHFQFHHQGHAEAQAAFVAWLDSSLV